MDKAPGSYPEDSGTIPQGAHHFQEFRMCDHHLIDIYTEGPDYNCIVVRWCSICGAIVIDRDHDGRTSPGIIMRMTLPTYEHLNK